MEKIKFSIINPTGNITGLVWSRVSRGNQPVIANQIMLQYPSIEQVGFIEKSSNAKEEAYLQMAGGEFCGNAVRALAYLLVEKGLVLRSKFYLGMSGVNKEILVECSSSNQSGSMVVKARIPINKNFNQIKSVLHKELNVLFHIVALEGITHILVDAKTFPFDKKNENYKKTAKEIIDYFGLSNRDAVSLTWIDQSHPVIAIKPVVWVKAVDTSVYEQSCGSGSLAVGLWYAKNNEALQQQYRITQPCQEFISIDVERNQQGFIKAYIAGAVENLSNNEITV